MLAMLATNISVGQFLQDFNATTFPPTGWVQYAGTNGLGTVHQWTNLPDPAMAPVTFAFSRFETLMAGEVSQDWLVSPLIPISATQNTLTFDATDFNTPSFGSILSIRVSSTSQTNIAGFTEVTSFTEAMIGNRATPSFASQSVNLSAFVGQSIHIAFVHIQTDGDAIAIDNVRVIQGATGVPLAATTPTPANMAMNVPVDAADLNMDGMPDNSVTLAWMLPAGNPATDYQIFFGTSATAPPLLGATPNTTVRITGLLTNTTYFWRAVPGNSAGRAANPITWSFTTGATAGVDDASVNFFTLSPNPAADFITINTDSPIEDISVYNLLGQVMMTNPVLDDNRFDVTNLQSGVYLITVSNGSNKQTARFIKN